MSLDRVSARDILSSVGTSAETNFHELSSTQVDALLLAANRHGYRAPPANHRNGSRARYFFAHCQRAARKER